MQTTDEFWDKVQRVGAGDCWLWSGATSDERGYGQTWWRGARQASHRLAWSLFYGRAIPDGLFVMHSCDNPGCCNPFHLSTGTHADNMRDCVEKGRTARGVRHGNFGRSEYKTSGERHWNSKLTRDQVNQIRTLLAAGPIPRKYLRERFGIGKSALDKIISGDAWQTPWMDQFRDMSALDALDASAPKLDQEEKE